MGLGPNAAPRSHSAKCLAFMRKLEGYGKKNGFENGRATPILRPDFFPLDNAYRRKTAAGKRLRHLQERLK